MLYQILKYKAHLSVLGHDTTRIANFVNFLLITSPAVHVHLPILALTFSLHIILAKKISRKI